MIVIPNVSEGRSGEVLKRLTSSVSASGTRVLDVHSDTRHNRSVITGAGETASEISAMVALAIAADRSIDLRTHEGIHPRIGALDVCPFVPHEGSIEEAIAAAHECGSRIAEEAGLPVYFYAMASGRGLELPELRRGGLGGLIDRVTTLPADRGPSEIDPASGVVCVGARDVLIAFNVFIEAGLDVATQIAAAIRERSGGLKGVRALGLPIDGSTSQVSMNLTTPRDVGIDAAFEAVTGLLGSRGGVTATEIVGLVPESLMPNPNAEAARLLMSPGRSLQSALDR